MVYLTNVQDGIGLLTEKSREAWREWDDTRKRKEEEEAKNSGVISKPTAPPSAPPATTTPPSSSSTSSSFECHDTIGLICLDAQGDSLINLINCLPTTNSF